MNWIIQVFAISAMNLRSLPARLGPSLVIVVGIAGVVTVLVALLAMAEGFSATLRTAGHPDRAIVLRGGSNDEMSSGISVEHAAIIASLKGIKRDQQGARAAGETYVIADIRKRSNDSDANLPMRGIEPKSLLIRDEIRMLKGRSIEFGKFELMAGVGAADQFQGLDLGNAVHIRGADWKVVGIFTAAGSVRESEVLVDNVVLTENLNRGPGYTSMLVQLESELDLDTLAAELEADPRLEATVTRETDYYKEQSSGLTQLIENFGYSVAVIMALGAVFAALNTMYAAVSTRSIEIATLRALGFPTGPVIASVMVESLLLALIGGLIGCVIAFSAFNGYTASTMNNATFSQVSFNFEVTTGLLVKGVLWSCALGLIGGLLPAISAARQPITAALRGN